MERISIQDLASSVLPAKRGLKKKDAERFATTLFDVVKDGLAVDHVVKIKGLGTFKLIDIDARESIDVNTGERVVIESHGRITFTPDTTMKEVVNRPFSQFETVVLNDGVEFDDSPVLEDETEMDADEDEVVGTIQEEVIKEEPVIAETQVTTEEPEPEPEPEEEQPAALLEFCDMNEEVPPVEETEEQAQDQEPEQEQDDSMDMLSDTKTRIPLIWWFVLLAACIGSFVGGYYFGKQSGTQRPVAEPETVSTITGTTKTDTIAKADTIVKADTIAKPDTMAPIVKKEEVPVAKPAVEPVKPQAEESTVHDKYALKDARVRTGAYRIVGTDYEVKVKAGETVARVAKRTLGPDMECYIEVYNDITSKTMLKEGQTLKIPKLEVKKKKTLTKE